ncbi:hypothetical protein [Yoonia sp.]|uniref:hypothetical protein n=1 Tax=Yoonia sp. TaxID=2212373 RepID=UPI002FD93A3D
MRWFILACLWPAAAFAQDFGAPPMPGTDEVHACILEQVALGPNALVSRAARDCIGRSVAFCEGDTVVCAAAEQAYWEWRIARTYYGLQAWVADSDDVAASVQQSVANPRTATANVPLECQLRAAGGQGGEAAPDTMATCMMRETALIALELEFSVRQACLSASGGDFAAYCGRE